MKNTHHTPGPWKYEPETKTIRSQKTNYWLATMDSWDGAVNHHANASLISAAPEMFSALVGAQKAIRAALPFLPADDQATFCGEWLDEINEVITKAKGGQP